MLPLLGVANGSAPLLGLLSERTIAGERAFYMSSVLVDVVLFLFLLVKLGAVF